MGRQKKTRKFAQMKRVIGQRDSRLKQNQTKSDPTSQSKSSSTTNSNNELIREVPHAPTNLFFTYNTALTPPYPILLDTNFLSHTVHHKLEVIPTFTRCLLANVRVCLTSCVLAELEKLGPKYRLALRIARDERFERLRCDHKGVYADDCIVDRVVKQRVWIVATNDRELKRRIRKVPGVPIVSVKRGGYAIERLPDVPEV